MKQFKSIERHVRRGNIKREFDTATHTAYLMRKNKTRPMDQNVKKGSRKAAF